MSNEQCANGLTVREALASGTGVLKAAGVENPGLDASLLLAEVLGVSRSSLTAAGPDPLTENSFAAFNGFIKRRLDGECVAYILGRKEFYGLEFLVNPAVLVPRPETETLVEIAKGIGGVVNKYSRLPRRKDCEQLSPVPSPQSPVPIMRVLDLCTGSGAVAIALKHERPEWEVWATDISAQALETAKTNAARLLPPDSINFCQGDLFESLHCSLPTAHCSLFTVIVSNPPYVPTAEIARLSPEVRGEPALALDGGGDGLDVIKKIITKVPEFLRPGGMLLLEADPRQMEKIAGLFEENGFTGIKTYNDLSGRERVIGGRR
jgi:release factor glutamine methyltransferase